MLSEGSTSFSCPYIPLNIIPVGKLWSLLRNSSLPCPLIEILCFNIVWNCTWFLTLVALYHSFFTVHYIFSSVQFHRSGVSDSLQPHESQHARPPCQSPTPRVHPKPCPWVGDAIQPSHPLLPRSPSALNLSQHQSLFKWVSSSYQVAKVLEFQLQHQSFQWTPRTDLL